MVTTRQRLVMATGAPTRKLRWVSIVTVAGALLKLLVLFGVPLSDEQIAGILTALIVLEPVAAFITGYLVAPSSKDVPMIQTERLEHGD